jgi:hypothetical protein
MGTIEHIPAVERFVGRLRSLCRPGGTVTVMTIDSSSILYRTARLARRFGVPLAFNRLYSAHHVHHFTHKSLIKLLEGADLKIRHSLHHSVPVAAVDIPVRGALRPLFLAAAAGLMAAGDITGMSYLQTIVAERPT